MKFRDVAKRMPPEFCVWPKIKGGGISRLGSLPGEVITNQTLDGEQCALYRVPPGVPISLCAGGGLIGWKMRGLAASLQKGERGSPNGMLTESLGSGVRVVMEL